MAFKKKIWSDRVAEFINRRILTKEDGTTELVTVARSEGTVSTEGDGFNAKTMNDLEQRIADEFSSQNETLAKQSKEISELNNSLSNNFETLLDGLGYHNNIEVNTDFICTNDGIVTFGGYGGSITWLLVNGRYIGCVYGGNQGYNAIYQSWRVKKGDIVCIGARTDLGDTIFEQTNIHIFSPILD